MICYKDKTFCRFYEDCTKAGHCGRALTEEVNELANQSGLLVCQFLERPECFDQRPADE